MAATRIQISLTEDQRARVDRAAAAEGVAVAELIRRALDPYLGDDPDPAPALATTFGADPAAEAPSRDTSRRGSPRSTRNTEDGWSEQREQFVEGADRREPG